MQNDAEKIRKTTCAKLLKRFEKKGYTLGYQLEEDFYVAHYELDYGNMVIGTTRRKQFKLLNTGEQPLNFDIETRHLRKYNLRLDPEKLVKLPPGEERTITLT